MWFHGVVLLAATALFSSVNCKATGLTKVNTPKTPVIAPLLSAEAPTQRMLRIDVNSEDGDEARGSGLSKQLTASLKDKVPPPNVLRQMDPARQVHDLDDGVVRKFFKYVAQHNKKHGEAISTVETLTAYYGYQRTAVMIQRGIMSSDRKTKKLAKKLEDEQFQNWLRHNVSPDRIFRELHLSTDPIVAFRVLEDDNYAYQAFKRYLDSYNRERNAEVTEYEVFQAIYGGRGLALMIQHALQQTHSAAVAAAVENMENAQFRYWHDVMGQHDDVLHKVFKDRPTSDEKVILERYIYFLRNVYGISRG